MAWLLAGTLFGMALSYYCPHEPAYAHAAAMSDKFAMCTVETLPAQSDAVFILDMVTGRLFGAAHNAQTGGFSQTYARNLAQDFRVVENAQYVLVPGRAILQSTGGVPPASGVVYVGELNSGMVNMYGFHYNQNRPMMGQPLVPVGSFRWRQGG